MKSEKQIKKEADLFKQEHLIFHIEKLNMFPTLTKGGLLDKVKLKKK